MRRISSTEFPSESLPVMALLTVSGGLQDAYSYIERGHVFANAQTGNIVLLAVSAAEGRWNNVLSYAIPLAAFIIGIAIACFIRKLCGNSPRTIHWRQHVLLAEMILLASSALNLGGCYMGCITVGCKLLKYKPLIKSLKIPKGYFLSQALVIGHPSFQLTNMPERNHKNINLI